MADIALSALATSNGRLDPVQQPATPDIKTLPAAEAIVAGAPVRIDATGGFTNANGTDTTENDVWGIALRSVGARESLTAWRRGVVDGFVLDALAYNAKIYVSNTDGRLGDVAGTAAKVVGRVVPGTATTIGTAFDKLLSIEL